MKKLDANKLSAQGSKNWRKVLKDLEKCENLDYYELFFFGKFSKLLNKQHYPDLDDIIDIVGE